MDFIEKLKPLEPTPLLTLPKNYRIAYLLDNGSWHWHDDCDLWQVWYLCIKCAELGRDCRIQDKTTLEVFGTEIAKLNLFYIGLTGRSWSEPHSQKKLQICNFSESE